MAPTPFAESKTPPRMANAQRRGRETGWRREQRQDESERTERDLWRETERRDRRCSEFSEQSAATTAAAATAVAAAATTAEPVSRSCSCGGSLRRHRARRVSLPFSMKPTTVPAAATAPAASSSTTRDHRVLRQACDARRRSS